MQFSEVYGQGDLITKLIREIKNERIPHARLFVGKEGDSKISLAFAWIQYLMCEDRGVEESCGVCKACQKNAKLIHPDVHFSFPVVPRKSGDKPTSNDYLNEWREAILNNPHLSIIDWLKIIKAENKQGNITAEEGNSILKKLALKPYESEYRILIMWLPEYLGAIGNKLLKIIEEPPPKTYFILLTENMDKILGTIQSRVQKVQVSKYANSDISKLLVNQEVDLPAAEATAMLAAGNMNLAKKLLTQVDTEINPSEHFQLWMRICFKNNAPEMMTWSDTTSSFGRENIKAFLAYGLTLVRECMAVKLVPDYDIRFAKNEMQFIANFSRALQFANIETLYVEINKVIAEIERNANAKITLLNLSMQLGKAFSAQEKAQTLT